MMIKRELIFAVFAGLVLACTSCSRQERIIKVADLPDTPEFEVDAQPQFAPASMSRKVHVDVGYIWKQNKLLVFPLLNLDGRYVGYTGDKFNYIELKWRSRIAILAREWLPVPDQSVERRLGRGRAIS